MFAAWASGRYLAMIPEHWRRDPSELISYLERWPVETAILPVVVLHQWAESRQGDSRALGALRHLVTTGEQLVVTQPIVELFERLRGCRLHNHYGPSESHVVTALTLDRDPATWPARPSIGRPDRQLRHLHPRFPAEPGADRRGRRALYRRREPGARLPEPPRPDGGEVRAASLLVRAGRAALCDGRPGAVARGRRDRVPRAASTIR